MDHTLRGPLVSSKALVDRVDRRAVVGSASECVLYTVPAWSTQLTGALKPEFGPSEAAIDTAERAASEKYRSWQAGRGMARGLSKLARCRALHSRLLAYIALHDKIFGGHPSEAHVVAVTQLMSIRTEFQELHSCQAAFDACGCQRCFPGLWRVARASEVHDPASLALAMQRVAATEVVMPDGCGPSADARLAFCRETAPSFRTSDGTLLLKSYTLPLAQRI